jgi:N-acetylglucosamine kinase-like BadF-type ATPase
VHAVGIDRALEGLTAALAAAWQDAGLQVAPVDCAVLALAGAGQPDVQQQILEWAVESSLSKRFRFAHDAEVALVAGTPDGWGIALVAGTGSVVFGANQEGQEETAGGWGYHFGDEGSGYWLGQSALRAVSFASDGRGPQTVLSEILLSRLDIREPRQMLAALARQGDLRLAIASLADAVVLASAKDDPVAQEILRSAVGHFACSIQAVADKLALGKSFPLALAGGVLGNAVPIQGQLLARLHAAGLRPSPVEVVAHPVLGCLRIGQRACSGD